MSKEACEQQEAHPFHREPLRAFIDLPSSANAGAPITLGP